MNKVLVLGFLWLLLGGVVNGKSLVVKHQIINGSAQLHNAHFQDLQVNGSLSFEDLRVDNGLVVNGSVDGKHLLSGDFKSNGAVSIEEVIANNINVNGAFNGKNIDVQNNLIVRGHLEGQRLTVLGDTKVEGMAWVTNSKLHNFEATGEKITFIKSKIDHIVIKNNTQGFTFFNFSKNKPQRIELKDNTVISGDIVFESNEGKVYLSEGSVIQGQVHGARVIQP